MYVCMYMCVCVCVCVCMCMYSSVCMYACMSVCVCMYPRTLLWLYLDAEVLVLPPVFYPQDSCFVGRRLFVVGTNSRPPVPSFVCCVGVACPCAGFLSFPAPFPCVFL